MNSLVIGAIWALLDTFVLVVWGFVFSVEIPGWVFFVVALLGFNSGQIIYYVAMSHVRERNSH